MRVGFLEGKVTENKGDVRMNLPQLLDRGFDRDAGGALEVPVLEHDDRCMGGTGNMVGGRDGHSQRGYSMGLIHLSFLRFP